mgnify:FL=1
MNLYHIKLLNGTDLIAEIGESDNDGMILIEPVEFVLDPNNGLFVKNWLLWSEANEIYVYFDQIIFYSPASNSTYNKYQQFFDQINGSNETILPRNIH